MYNSYLINNKKKCAKLAHFFCCQALLDLLLFYSLNLECFTFVVFNENVEHDLQLPTFYNGKLKVENGKLF